MASTVNGVTTYFVGSYFEQTGSAITKYYYAGSQRVAMRKTIVPQNTTLTYLLGDHLGSTSLSMDTAGNVLTELRYTAWGQVRYQAGATPTHYTYTGQYSNTADFGLMFYNSRWYDPAIGRFAQADSVVPSGVQGLDRYAYTNNSPVKYTDPSGHSPCDDLTGYACRIRMNNRTPDLPHITPSPSGAPCSQDKNVNHYCRLPNGGSIDISHYNITLATSFWDALYSAWKNGDTTFTWRPDQTAGFGPFTKTFQLKYTIFLTGLTEPQLAQVGAGVWWDFQIRFEMWESKTFGDAGKQWSGFSNEDIPSTYIAYAAAVNNWDFHFAILMAGGGSAVGAEVPIASQLFTSASCVDTVSCGSDSPRNVSIYLKVQADDGSWSYLPYNEFFPVPLFGPQYYQYEKCLSGC